MEELSAARSVALHAGAASRLLRSPLLLTYVARLESHTQVIIAMTILWYRNNNNNNMIPV